MIEATYSFRLQTFLLSNDLSVSRRARHREILQFSFDSFIRLDFQVKVKALNILTLIQYLFIRKCHDTNDLTGKKLFWFLSLQNAKAWSCAYPANEVSISSSAQILSISVYEITK